MAIINPDYAERVYAGVLGKLIGVYAGRPFEGWTHERIMRELGTIRYYVNDRRDVTLRSTQLVVTDDDVAGTFIFPRALADNGWPRDLTAAQVGEAWLNYIVEERSVLWWGGLGNSTEHTAYLRLKAGVPAPRSGSIGLNGRTVAEQIGAQIFIDGWAMVSPGDPELAAHLARQAGSVSHDGASVQAAMLLAAMQAQAFVESDVQRLLDTGLGYVPADSAIRRLVEDVRNWHAADNARDWRNTFARIAGQYGYDKYPGNCHIVPNHALIILTMLYARDFSEAISISCTAGWDTDCNAGNVGCLFGIKDGLAGIDAGPDWRGPVADRMYLSSADGGGAISDAVIEARALVQAGYRLAGAAPPAPARDGARFAFEFPGSFQGFRNEPGDPSVVAPAVLENVPHGNGRVLAIRYHGLAPGRVARVCTRTFFDQEVFGMRSYKLMCAPTLYPGQEVEISVAAAAGNPADIIVRGYINIFGAADRVEQIAGPEEVLAAGESTVLRWRVPPTDGCPVYEVGLELVGTGAGTVLLGAVSWHGAPDAVFRRPETGGEMWRHAWVDDASQFQTRWEAFRVTQGEGRGMIITGTREWHDYAVEASLKPYLAQVWGLGARVQGRRRYLAVLFDAVGEGAAGQRARLVRVCGAETTLCGCAFAWVPDRAYAVRLEVEGSRVTAFVDGEKLLEAEDETFAAGGVALVVEVGSVGTEMVSIRPV